MAIRYYLTPAEVVDLGGGTIYRGPKYFQWRFCIECNVVPISGEAAFIDYGLMPTFLVCANVSSADHTFLAGLVDVTDVPLNIDAFVTQAALIQVQEALEGLKIPGNWVTTSHTYRQVLRAVAGLFQFAGKYHEMHGEELVDSAINLSMTWGQVPQAKKEKVIATADFFGIDYSEVNNNWTLRQILKLLADFWQSNVFNFGFTTL